MKYIFDLDNTLVFTDLANNTAYNAVLQRAGLPPIQTQGRITRETVGAAYPQLSQHQLEQIIQEKQAVFSPALTRVALPLLERAANQGRENCLVWSSADPARAIPLMEHHGLGAYFFDVCFSPKRDVCRELGKILQEHSISPGDVVVFEDAAAYIAALRGGGFQVVEAGSCL